MTLTITSLSVRERITKHNGLFPDVPYAEVNCTFKIEHEGTKDLEFDRVLADSTDFQWVLTIDDPDKYEEWLSSDAGWNFSSNYDGYGRAWTHTDIIWHYIPKFETFHFREHIANTPVTKTILDELFYYKEHGKLPSVYRFTDQSIITRHLKTLHSYWD